MDDDLRTENLSANTGPRNTFKLNTDFFLHRLTALKTGGPWATSLT